MSCPNGHMHLPESWQAAGNRCAYPGCGYAGNPTSTGILPGSGNNLSSSPISDFIIPPPVPPPAPPIPPQPLDIRVQNNLSGLPHIWRTRRPWWPTFWPTLRDVLIVTVIAFMLDRLLYVGFLGYGIELLVSALVLTLLRVF